jgi:hypothetical protein
MKRSKRPGTLKNTGAKLREPKKKLSKEEQLQANFEKAQQKADTIMVNAKKLAEKILFEADVKMVTANKIQEQALIKNITKEKPKVKKAKKVVKHITNKSIPTVKAPGYIESKSPYNMELPKSLAPRRKRKEYN